MLGIPVTVNVNVITVNVNVNVNVMLASIYIMKIVNTEKRC